MDDDPLDLGEAAAFMVVSCSVIVATLRLQCYSTGHLERAAVKRSIILHLI